MCVLKGPQMPDPAPDDHRFVGETAIHAAARVGDVEELERLLADGADVNERADIKIEDDRVLPQLTPLMSAARSTYGATVETLRWLVEHGADIGLKSRVDESAAWYAAGLGGRTRKPVNPIASDYAERLGYLLDCGMDVHERRISGETLLTEACFAGDPARVSLLLERGIPCSLDEQYPDATPIFCAAASGSAACVRLLLDAGVAANYRSDSGDTALMCAGSPEVVSVLLAAGADLHAVNDSGNDALDTALRDEFWSFNSDPIRPDVARALLDAGADLDHRDNDQCGRIARAAFGHHDHEVLFLASAGADVRAKCWYEGRTALHAICWQGEYEDPSINASCERIIRALVEAGLDPNVLSDSGVAPMHEAVSGDWGNPTAVRTLLELNADPDIPDSDGVAPLELVVSIGKPECVELLLNAGADPNRRCAAGDTLLDFARESLAGYETFVKSDECRQLYKELDANREARIKELYADLGIESIEDRPQDIPSHASEQILAERRRVVELIEQAVSD